MKKLFTLLSLMFVLSLGALAQEITVDLADLTPDQLTKIKAEKALENAEKEIEIMKNKMEMYGDWVGIGGEVGTAVKEGLGAVVDVADDFGKTDVGKYTMILIAWKVIGKDITEYGGNIFRVVLGIVVWLIIIGSILKLFRHLCLPKRRYKERVPLYMRLFVKREYEYVEARYNTGDEVSITSVVTVIVICIITAIMWNAIF